MSHGKLRKDTTCLNCGHQAEERFCPHCGQENTETRQPFHYLFTHFIEDFTHYDGQFWKTMKYLLLRPGKLTSEYLSGKRQSYVAPVKLYIFISFITFFLFAVFPPLVIDFNKPQNANEKILFDNSSIDAAQKAIANYEKKEILTAEDSLAIQKMNNLLKDSAKLRDLQSRLDMNKKMDDDADFSGYTTQKSFDSAMAKNPSTFDFIKKPLAHKFFELKENGVKKGDILKSLLENGFHNLPKALFIYLPLFAFFLWLFHDKKNWWYFDHGIFTLHYFSFLLISILLFSLLYKIADISSFGLLNTLIYLVMTAIFFYSFIYFFIAQHKVYKTHGFISVLIGSIIFAINFFAFTFLVTVLALISFLMIH